jgi:hypothetical protein
VAAMLSFTAVQNRLSNRYTKTIPMATSKVLEPNIGTSDGAFFETPGRTVRDFQLRHV